MNILLTSAGRRTYMVQYFKNVLHGSGLVHASNSIMTYTLSQADKYVITPPIYDDYYIDFLLDYCKRENISAIISLFDIDLPVLSKNKKLFKENGINIIVSDEWVTELCNDKWRTYCFLKSNGFNQATTYISLDKAEQSLDKGIITFPVIVKPRWGMGSIGIYQADTLEELRTFYAKLRRQIFDTYLKYESSIDKDACVVIQQKIMGQEYGLDVLNDLNGNYVTTIAKKKIAMRAGETDVAEIIENSPFSCIGQKLSETLKHIANLDVDCFMAETGEIYILELNCRFGGQYPFSHNAGVDFPKQITIWLNGGPTYDSLITPKLGVISCKELSPVIIHVPQPE